MAFPGTKHGPRRRPYRILWQGGSQTVSAADWQRAIADGWIVPAKRDDGQASDRIAQLADGVIARLTDGVLWLRNKLRQIETWIYTSWRAIDRSAPMVRGEFWQKEVERQYAPVAPNPDADIVDRWGQLEGPGGVPVRV